MRIFPASSHIDGLEKWPKSQSCDLFDPLAIVRPSRRTANRAQLLAMIRVAQDERMRTMREPTVPARLGALPA